MDSRIDEILEITSLVPTSELKPEPSTRVIPKRDGNDDDIREHNKEKIEYY